MTIVKICQVDLFMMYFDPTIGYQHEHFQVFCDVVDNNFATIPKWVTNINIGAKTLTFWVIGHILGSHFQCSCWGYSTNVQGCFLVSIAQVKVQCFVTSDMLISKLNRCFVDFKLMNALGICISTILDGTWCCFFFLLAY